jgi:hypothetical protein
MCIYDGLSANVSITYQFSIRASFENIQNASFMKESGQVLLINGMVFFETMTISHVTMKAIIIS